ncbi:MAG: CAP domain-containing protein [Acidobacteria bacterium]|nr:CAP domain-containing protein [Acidobacteriota bacterium]
MISGLTLDPKKTGFFLFPILLFFLTSILTVSGQDAAAPGEMRVRYITSASSNTAESKPVIRFEKKTENAGKTTSLKDIDPDDNALERKTFDLINKKRSETGLQTLVWNEEVAKLARQHSQNMARHDFFSHIGLNGRLVDQRAIDFGLDGWRSIGENIAFCQGFSNPEEFVVQRWMLSDGHRTNLLNKMWKESGIGMARTTEGKYFFTQIFIMK